MPQRQILVAISVPDTTEADDQSLADGLFARLNEWYANGEVIVPFTTRIAVGTAGAVTTLLAAAEVGLDGDVPEPFDLFAAGAATLLETLKES
jgi:hypothetical protein